MGQSAGKETWEYAVVGREASGVRREAGEVNETYPPLGGLGGKHGGRQVPMGVC